jgi:hypothetical protein
MSSRFETLPEANFLFNLAFQNLSAKFDPKLKPGNNQTVGVTKEDIWTQSGSHTFMSAAAAIHISSSASVDQGVGVTVEYLDANWLPQTLEVLTDGTDGQTEVVTSINAIRINNAWVSSGGPAAGKIYLYEDDTVVAGVPQTATKIHAVLEIADQKTQHSWFSMPAGYDGIVIYWEIEVTSAIEVTGRLERQLFGGSFTTEDRLVVNDSKDYSKKPIRVYVPPKADIKLTGIAASGTPAVLGELQVIQRKL